MMAEIQVVMIKPDKMPVLSETAKFFGQPVSEMYDEELREVIAWLIVEKRDARDEHISEKKIPDPCVDYYIRTAPQWAWEAIEAAVSEAIVEAYNSGCYEEDAKLWERARAATFPWGQSEKRNDDG